jgi:ribosome-associated toxin RatA of RatAB toxin-antitoxin module
MKDNSGSWELKPLDNGKTEVTYTVRLDLNFSVPGFVMKSLVASSLPGMMAAFEKRAKEKARV